MLTNTEKYIKLRHGIKLHYYGDAGYASYENESVAYFNEQEMQCLALIDGKKTLTEIKNNYINTYKHNDSGDFIEDIDTILQKLKRKRLIVESNVPFENENSIYGEKGKYYPKDIAIELTNMCNYRCSFCYKNASGTGTFISDDNINKLDKIIRGKVKSILLTGGEPTLHPHFSTYTDLFSQYADVRIITNGSNLFNIESETIRRLKHIQFSLYGCNNQEYKRNTGAEDGFTRLSKSVELAINNNISFSIACTLKAENYKLIEDYVNAALELNANIIRIGPAEPYGREQDTFNLTLYNSNIKIFMDELLRLRKKYIKKINVALKNINIDHITNNDFSKNLSEHLNCGFGTENIVISQSGKIRACQFLPEKYFDIGDISYLKRLIDRGGFTKTFECCAKNYLKDGNAILKTEFCKSLKLFCDQYHLEY